MHAKYISATALIGATANAAWVRPTVDNSCGNQGYTVRVFEHASPQNASKPTDWDWRTMDTLTPDYTAVVNTIGGIRTSPELMQSIYGSPLMDHHHYGADHQGWFFTEYTGMYTVELKDTDDAAYVWMGKDCEVTGGQTLVAMQALNGALVTKQIYVEAFRYVKFKARWANVMAGPASFWLKVTDPKGNVVMGPTAPATNNLIWKLCTENETLNQQWVLSGLQ